jgi:cytochrome P450
MGSDTTAATLTCLFFELSRNPRCLKLLQEEIDELHKTEKDVHVRSLGKLPYLEAVINEALRLHPPVPSGVQRISPPEGLRIGETFIPGDTIIQIPTYTMFRGNAD